MYDQNKTNTKIKNKKQNLKQKQIVFFFKNNPLQLQPSEISFFFPLQTETLYYSNNNVPSIFHKKMIYPHTP